MSSSMSKIFQRLKPKTRFCKGGIHLSWPSPPVTPRPRQFPLQVPNLIKPSEHPLSLWESTYYLLAPKECGAQRQKPWIVRVEEVDPTTWRLVNPSCGLGGLFCEADPPIMGRTDDPSNYLIKELATSYTLVDDHSEVKRLEMKASKVIPLSGSNTCMNQSEQGKLLLAIDWDKKLYLWQQGDAYWTRILDNNRYGFEDIVSCKGKFYAADELGTFFEIDPTKSSNEDEFSKIISAPDIPEKNRDFYKHLLMGEYEGQVHLLLRPTESIMRAYVLEDGHGGEPHKWNTVKSLNNNVLFILNEVSYTFQPFTVILLWTFSLIWLFVLHVSFCLHPTVLKREFEGDWICFADDLTHYNRNDLLGCGGETAGIFCDDDYYRGLNGLEYLRYPCYFDHFAKGMVEENQMDENVTSFYSLSDHEYVSLFFPPPPWIQYYALDADKDNPFVWFDKCSLPKYEFF